MGKCVAEITDHEDLRRWLDGKPGTAGVAIAARAALRALPILMTEMKSARDPRERAANLVLPVLRATTTSWVASFGSTLEVRSAAAYAARAARDVRPTSVNANAAYAASTAAARAADAVRAYAARSTQTVVAINPIYSQRAAEDAITLAAAAYGHLDSITIPTHPDSISNITDGRGRSIAEIAAAAADTRAATIWDSVAADCEALDTSLDPAPLAPRPLWPAGISSWARRQWLELRAVLLELDEDWEVWIRWYEARLDGRAANNELEVKRVTFLTEEEWQQGPEVVNRRIKELEREYGSDEGAEIDEELLGQIPASHSYALRNSRIVAVPQRGETLDDAAVSEILPELKEKARDYCEAAKGSSNCPPRVLRTATGLNEILHQWDTNPQPGSLLMRLRSLEGDLLAYDTPEGRAELFPNAIASMADLQASVGDLISLYPLVQKMQASALALNIQRSDVVSIHLHLTTIESAAADSGSVDESAQAALSEGRADVEDATQTIETSTDERKVANAIEQRADKTAFRVLSARNFVSAALKATQEGTIDGVKDGFKGVVAGGIKTGFAVLVGTLAEPVAGIATFIASWSPFSKKAEEIEKHTESNNDSDKA